MTCSGAWLKAGMRGTDIKGEQREQRERRRVHTVSIPHTLQAGAIHLRNEGVHSSSAVQCLSTGSSMGSRPHVPRLPVATAGCVPCDAEARREPSRRLCSIFRKSKDPQWAMFIYRCNASRLRERARTRPKAKIEFSRDRFRPLLKIGLCVQYTASRFLTHGRVRLGQA